MPKISLTSFCFLALILVVAGEPSHALAQVQVFRTSNESLPWHGPDNTAYARNPVNNNLIFKNAILVNTGADRVGTISLQPGQTLLANFAFFSTWENGIHIYNPRTNQVVYSNSRGQDPTGLHVSGDYINGIGIRNTSNQIMNLWVIGWHKLPGNASDQGWLQNRVQLVMNPNGTATFKFEDGNGMLNFDASSLSCSKTSK